MIKAIAFDLGGVLFSNGTKVLVGRLQKQKRYIPEVVIAMITSGESKRLRKGIISDRMFWSSAQKSLPEGYDVQKIKEFWYGCYVLDRKIYGLIRKLRKNYKIIAFSGNIKSRVSYLEHKYRFRKLFHKEVYSFDYGTSKPEKKFVKVLIKKAGVRPSEIIYIDDKKTDSEVAKSFGINVLIYGGDITRLKEGLKKHGIMV